MDPDNAFLIICVGIAGAIGIPAVLYLSLRRGHDANAISLMRHAVGRARQPWKDEEEDLAELARRVAELQAKESSRKEGRDHDEG
jgi:hypothetical protein